jgi:hypothetical protein
MPQMVAAKQAISLPPQELDLVLDAMATRSNRDGQARSAILWDALFGFFACGTSPIW